MPDSNSNRHIHINVPGSVYRYAMERAGGTAYLLKRRIEEFVINYANGTTAQQRGGQAVAGRLTPEERTEKGRAAAAVRWGKRDEAEPASEPPK
jgi:hypothetical protein